nr:hypothetical protein CFP56_75176 [Quercus suber]
MSAIFVPNLPMNATVEQLEAVFNNFGPIKHNGIQVGSSKSKLHYKTSSSVFCMAVVINFSYFVDMCANNDRGSRGYGRNDFERRGDFSNRTRGNAGRNEETGRRVYQNGGWKSHTPSQSRQHELGYTAPFAPVLLRIVPLSLD